MRTGAMIAEQFLPFCEMLLCCDVVIGLFDQLFTTST
jgi:hypothetical protein